jgi:MFS family permease
VDARRGLPGHVHAAARRFVVVVALPSMRTDLGGTFADAQWVLDAYTLALAGLIMVGAVLADRLGRRRIFAAGVAIFTLASGACALADAPLVLNVGRAVQGLGGGLVLATAIPLIATAYSGPRRAAAVGTWAATIGLAVAVGPLVGGLLTEGLGWRWSFLVNVPLGAAALSVVRPAMPHRGHGRRPAPSASESFGPPRPLDPLGIAVLTTGLLALVFGTVRGGPEGWGSPAIVGALGLGVAVMAVYFAGGGASSMFCGRAVLNIMSLGAVMTMSRRSGSRPGGGPSAGVITRRTRSGSSASTARSRT